MEYLGLNKNTGTIHEDETKLLEGFVVAVTGATSGIGLELTRALAKRGATVIAIGRSKGKLQQLQAQSTNIQTVVADLTDLESVANAAEQMLKDYDHIDVLVNNAGIHMGFNMYETPTTKQGYDIVFGGM
jgi:meso-butanediol dehydrogenase/(S,S)-butanediol dehydrogenase/diacetyl reductase